MKLPSDSVIAPEKLTSYLSDKHAAISPHSSQPPATPWQYSEQLLGDLREQVLPHDAVLLEKTKFGQFYEIRASLVGPNRITLRIRSIWMKEHLSGLTKFITLMPER